jgi:hypothetical protein
MGTRTRRAAPQTIESAAESESGPKGQGNEDDLVAFMQDKMLPVDEIEIRRIAQDLLTAPPEQGYLTISNALQWRLQYGRVITQAGLVSGITRIR